MKLKHICLQTWHYSIRHASWSIENQREKLLDPPSDITTNTVKLYQARLLLCQYNMHACWSSATTCRELLCRFSCNIYACRPSVTATNTAAVQTCPLVECCCKMDDCWTVATQLACMSIFCQSILHVCWRCASLSAITTGTVTHYHLCLLVLCLT